MDGKAPSCGPWLAVLDSGGNCSQSRGSEVIRSHDVLGDAAAPSHLHKTRG